MMKQQNRDEDLDESSSSSQPEDYFPNIVSIPLDILGLNKEEKKEDNSSQKKPDGNSSKEADLEDIINFISYLFKQKMWLVVLLYTTNHININ